MKKQILALICGVGLLAPSLAGAALVTDPNDVRNWQGATVGTFAQLAYGSNTLANRTLVVNSGLLDDGLFDTTGLTYGSYYGNAVGGKGASFADGTYGYGGTALTYNQAADDLDWAWVQDTGSGGSSWTQANVWDLGGQANQAVVFPIVDHDPLPQEALEYSVYLSNNPFATTIGLDGNVDWVAAALDQVFLEGWAAGQIADGFTTVWRLPNQQTFRYVAVFAGGPLSYWADGDDEIDAVAGLTFEGDPLNTVPEPGTVLLMGSGLVGLALWRRKRA